MNWLGLVLGCMLLDGCVPSVLTAAQGYGWGEVEGAAARAIPRVACIAGPRCTLVLVQQIGCVVQCKAAQTLSTSTVPPLACMHFAGA